MTKGCVRHLLLISSVLILFVALLSALWANAPGADVGQDGELYFLAGTITKNGYLQTYPVTLYTSDNRERLMVVRQIYRPAQGLYDFSDDLHGHIYMADATNNYSTVMTVLHERDPLQVDRIPLKNFNDDLCWGAVAGDQIASGVQYCELESDQVFELLADAEPSRPRVVDGSWTLFKNLQYAGAIGGPFQVRIGARIVSGNVVLPGMLRVPKVALIDIPPLVSAGKTESQWASVIASTDRFFIFLATPAEFLGGDGVVNSNPESVGHSSPLPIHVYDKVTGKWRTIELPTTMTRIVLPPIRLLGTWLATTVSEWRPGPDVSPGHDQERKWPPTTSFSIGHYATDFPDINGGYANTFIDLYLPGKIVLDDLLDGRRINLNTGQEDSEVLLIQNGAILYRVNDSIYSAKIVDDQVIQPKLVVTDTDVPEIHWAFWGPAAKTTNSK